MLMVPKSARAHSIKSRVVPKSAVARERVKKSKDVLIGVIPLYVSTKFGVLSIYSLGDINPLGPIAPIGAPVK